jgi:hypothetical protein
MLLLWHGTGEKDSSRGERKVFRVAGEGRFGEINN